MVSVRKQLLPCRADVPRWFCLFLLPCAIIGCLRFQILVIFLEKLRNYILWVCKTKCHSEREERAWESPTYHLARRLPQSLRFFAMTDTSKVDNSVFFYRKVIKIWRFRTKKITLYKIIAK
jgi:hypothetical protein